MTAIPAPDISICICTFKRPDLLDRLLAAIAEQDTAGRTLEVVVVDNDPAGSAASVLQTWQDSQAFALVPRHVPIASISLARNAAIAAATAPWLVLVDDDEEPDAGWLTSFIAAQAQSQADGMFGPVVPRYLPQTPDWVIQGGYFERPRHVTGTRISHNDARSGNVYIRRALLQSVPGPFDPACGLTGGEDTLLFGQLLRQGAVFVWCDEAIVREEVPAERARLGWILRRAYRGGQSFIRAEMQASKGFKRLSQMLYLGLRALLQLLVAVVLMTVLWPFRRPRAIHWMKIAAAQLGKLVAFSGRYYKEYA